MIRWMSLRLRLQLETLQSNSLQLIHLKPINTKLISTAQRRPAAPPPTVSVRSTRDDGCAPLAAALLRFTPDVCRDGSAALLLEIGRTAMHFGGEERTALHVRDLCARFGFVTAIGIAPTPEAARALARAAELDGSIAPRHAPGDDLRALVAPLPWQALAPEPAVAETCAALGLRTIGELLALPRAGLATRTTIAFVQQLKRLLGELDEPLVRITPPEQFEQELQLAAAATTMAPLLFAAQHLLAAAECELEHHARALDAATFTFVPLDRAAPWRIELRPTEPTRSARLLLTLLSHRLERERLMAPVEIVRLSFARTVALEPEQEQLFTTQHGCDRGSDRDGNHDPTRGSHRGGDRDRAHAHAVAVLTDRLAIRLGRERVNRLELVADHRPERAFRLRCHGEAAVRPPATAAPLVVPPGMRPLTLERQPRPIAALPGTCVIVRGPERIAAGWWDGDDVVRDYFEVEAADGTRRWLFRDCASGGWFQHGEFG